MKKDGFRCDPPIKLSSWWWRRFCVASDPSSCVHRRRDFARRRFFPEQRFFAEEALSRWSFVLLLKMVAPLNFIFSLSYTSHLILRFCLTDGVVGFFLSSSSCDFLSLRIFLYPYAAACFEPSSVSRVSPNWDLSDALATELRRRGLYFALNSAFMSHRWRC